MSRLEPVTQADATADQTTVWNAITATRGSVVDLVGPDGGLTGPFNAMVSSPHIGGRIAELGAAVRAGNSLPPDLMELAICVTGTFWQAEFEWWAHRRLAARAGVDESILDSLEAGETPLFDREVDAAVHRFVTEMLTSNRVSDDTWSTARSHLSEQQVIDLVSTAGYYCLISCMLNTFAIGLPDGVEPVWSP